MGSRTPHGVCIEFSKSADLVGLASGNKSFGYTKTETARRAQHENRKRSYNCGLDDLHSIKMAMKELACEDKKLDPAGSMQFFGGIHDLQITNTGELESISIYNALSVRIAAEEIMNNPAPTVVLDCTGNIVSDVPVSRAADLSRRSESKTRKKPLKQTSDNHLVFDVLNFHLVLPLPIGPYIACEAVIVGKTAKTFQDILIGFRRRLSHFGPNAEHIKYFVTDMAAPFAIAITNVFNNMNVPAYMSTLAYAAKLGDQSIFRTSI